MNPLIEEIRSVIGKESFYGPFHGPVNRAIYNAPYELGLIRNTVGADLRNTLGFQIGWSIKRCLEKKLEEFEEA